MSEVTKQKAGKLQWDTIFRHVQGALAAMVRVREYGNEKYSRIAAEHGVPLDPESWRQNPPGDYYASAARHLMALMRGERINHEDGGCHHAAQAMIDLAFAYEIENAAKPEPTSDAYYWTDDGARQRLVIDRVEDLPPLEWIIDVLSRKRRWADHFDDAISVARHCILVTKIAWEDSTRDRRLVRACLLHDAHESLYGDTPTPLKHLQRGMLPPGVTNPNDALAAKFDAALEKKYDVNLSDPRIKRADLIAGCVEACWRGIRESALCEWYSADVVEASRPWRLKTHIAWPAHDDAAQWWRCWEANQ